MRQLRGEKRPAKPAADYRHARRRGLLSAKILNIIHGTAKQSRAAVSSQANISILTKDRGRVIMIPRKFNRFADDIQNPREAAKSFLVLFFKKELLSFNPIEPPSAAYSVTPKQSF
jgi:hypothetical protein